MARRGAPRGQDAADRVRPASGLATTATRGAASGNLRLSRLHPLLRVDAGWPVYREAQDAKQAPDAQADGAAPGGMAAYARANGRAATLVRQHPARSLRLLWAAEQLPRVERVSPGGPTHLVPMSTAAQSEGPEPHLGPLQSDARALSSATASDHSSLGDADGMTRVTLGKSRMRESCKSGSVGVAPCKRMEFSRL